MSGVSARLDGVAPALLTAALLVLAPREVLALQILPTFLHFSPGEEALVAASVSFWEATIRDPFDVAITLEKRALGGDTLARASEFVTAPDGRPASARVEIDDRVGSSYDWFVDPTPLDTDEFIHRHGRLIADPAGPAWLAFDLLSVVHHELAHALGFTVSYAAFAAHVETDVDGRRRYRSATLDVPLAGSGTHLSGAVFPMDLMTDLFGVGERRTVSRLDVELLADAFGYFPVLPPMPPQVPEPAVPVMLAVAAVVAATRRMVLG